MRTFISFQLSMAARMSHHNWYFWHSLIFKSFFYQITGYDYYRSFNCLSKLWHEVAAMLNRKKIQIRIIVITSERSICAIRMVNGEWIMIDLEKFELPNLQRRRIQKSAIVRGNEEEMTNLDDAVRSTCYLCSLRINHFGSFAVWEER